MLERDIVMTTAILLMGHGSRVAEANQALYSIAGMLRGLRPGMIVEVAFREQHPPDIQAGIDACVRHGAQRVLLYPYFLFAGAHVLEDLPVEMAEARRRHPGLQLAMGEHLGAHPKLAEIVAERVDEAFGRAGWQP
jgi:sirohydrochlorin ferrochelatase